MYIVCCVRDTQNGYYRFPMGFRNLQLTNQITVFWVAIIENMWLLRTVCIQQFTCTHCVIIIVDMVSRQWNKWPTNHRYCTRKRRKWRGKSRSELGEIEKGREGGGEGREGEREGGEGRETYKGYYSTLIIKRGGIYVHIHLYPSCTNMTLACMWWTSKELSVW